MSLEKPGQITKETAHDASEAFRAELTQVALNRDFNKDPAEVGGIHVPGRGPKPGELLPPPANHPVDVIIVVPIYPPPKRKK